MAMSDVDENGFTTLTKCECAKEEFKGEKYSFVWRKVCDYCMSFPFRKDKHGVSNDG